MTPKHPRAWKPPWGGGVGKKKKKKKKKKERKKKTAQSQLRGLKMLGYRPFPFILQVLTAVRDLYLRV